MAKPGPAPVTDTAGLGLLHPLLPRLAVYTRMARPHVEKELRTRGTSLPPSIAALWDELDGLAVIGAGKLAVPPVRLDGTSGTPRLPDQPPAQILPTMSTAAAAEQLEISERAVRARLRRGTLAGRLVGGTWQVDAGAVLAMARRTGGGAA